MSILKNVNDLINEMYIPNEEPNPYFKRNKMHPSNTKIRELNAIHSKVDRSIKNRNIGNRDLLEEMVEGLEAFIQAYKYKEGFEKPNTYINTDTEIIYSARKQKIVDNSIREIVSILSMERGVNKKTIKRKNLLQVLSNLHKIYYED